MNEIANDILMHYGMPRRSGRYPWGSGDNPYQHGADFISRVDEMRANKFTYTDENGKSYSGDLAIAKSMGLSSGQFRVQLSLANDERRNYEYSRAKSLRDKGYSYQKIAEEMGYNSDSSIRNLLDEDKKARRTQARQTADFLKEMVDAKGMIDVTSGAELELGCSQTKLAEALYILELEGYPTYGGRQPQMTNKDQKTTIKVLCPPGTEHKDIYQYDKINSIKDYEKILTEDGTKVRNAFEYPASVDSSRIDICYGDKGGAAKDGVIELRRGVKDLSLGESHYAQVRILVDGTHYLKGMALYSDDLPPGVDIRFNTNKPESKGKLGVMKEIKSDPENPFGSLLKEHGGQSYYDDPNGKFVDPVTGKKQSLSAINKTREEGDWNDWSDSLPSQFLSKQSMQLINRQLDLTKKEKKAEFDEIMSIDNPTIKKAMLKNFADNCDSDAVDLQAASLPRQKYQVILPLNTIKDNEIYAPNYKDGETVALIRYPHGGTFEIPILKVNNRQTEGKRVISPEAKDAVGINSKVAERLSGADFDGDTVMVIPCNSPSSSVFINSTRPLKGLEGFDNKVEYGYSEKKVDSDGTEHYYRNGKEFKIMKNTNMEMGKVSNLITDMTLQGAPEDDIAKAVRHSMVVIDAEKHKLDYKQSEVDNDISRLKREYQGHFDDDGKFRMGAGTLISRAKSPYDVEKRVGQPRVNQKGKPWYDESKPEGALIFKSVHETYNVTSKTGKVTEKVRTTRSTKMAETDDAMKWVSEARTPQELAYADYANFMKSLANRSRKEMVYTGNLKYDKHAKERYSAEVASLNSKLKDAMANSPKERQAQRLAGIMFKDRTDGLELSNKEKKKISAQCLAKARVQLGAKKQYIDISDNEWKAIQAGAITENTLNRILNNTRKEDLAKRATPRQSNELSNAQISKIKNYSGSGYTNAEIAEALGISVSTVHKYI